LEIAFPAALKMFSEPREEDILKIADEVKANHNLHFRIQMPQGSLLSLLLGTLIDTSIELYQIGGWS
jgi:hypothetical protein